MSQSSVARGVAVIAVVGVALVGARAAWLCAMGAAPAEAAPVCAVPVELEGPDGVRVACAADTGCDGARAGDRVGPGCRIERGGMTARARLLTGVRIDVNRAAAADLALLEGIGPKLSEEIVAERERAAFAGVDDLLRVRGIGPVRLEAMRPYVTAE